MTPDPYSFNVSLGSDTGSNAPRYIAPPFNARRINDRETLLLMAGSDHPQRVTLEHTRLLAACDRLRDASEHAAHIVRALGLPASRTGAIEQAVLELAGRDLLIDQQQVLQRIGSGHSSEHPAPLTTLFIRTCRRPEMLERLLTQAARSGLPETLKHLVVIDGDSRPQGQRDTARLLDTLRPGLSPALIHLAKDRQHQLIEQLADDAGVDGSDLGWFLTGDPADPALPYGSAVNLALLLGAGQRMAMLDDDAVLEAYRFDAADDRPALVTEPAGRLQFIDPEADFSSQFRPSERHPIEEHAQILGECCALLVAAGREHPEVLLDGLDPQLLSVLSAGATVKLTTSGTLGDPGTSGIEWVFGEPPRHLSALCRDENAGRALLFGRQLARAPEHLQATPNYDLMTTTLTGIDNRELLLPTQAKGRNEDLLFGALVTYLHPRSLHVSLPHMLVHRRTKPRRWCESDLDRSKGTNRGAFLSQHIRRLGFAVDADDIDSRVGLLRHALANLATLSDAEIRAQLCQDLLHLRGQTVERIRMTRRSMQLPDWLAGCFDRVLAAQGQLPDAAGDPLAQMAGELRAFCRRYVSGLAAWQRAWHHARDTRLIERLTRS
ncbi:MAG: hypothetical protein HND55_04745 [Pseudomonadota bacterium]|nr:MAG: hypothetical protein HND55_04745 [Pseudomonadota bacterium]